MTSREALLVTWVRSDGGIHSGSGSGDGKKETTPTHVLETEMTILRSDVGN